MPWMRKAERPVIREGQIVLYPLAYAARDMASFVGGDSKAICDKTLANVRYLFGLWARRGYIPTEQMGKSKYVSPEIYKSLISFVGKADAARYLGIEEKGIDALCEDGRLTLVAGPNSFVGYVHAERLKELRDTLKFPRKPISDSQKRRLLSDRIAEFRRKKSEARTREEERVSRDATRALEEEYPEIVSVSDAESEDR